MEVTTNYRKQFLEYVSTNVMSMIGMSIYILADTYFISKGLGAKGLTALNLALPMYNFVEGLGQMVGIGGASFFIVHRVQGQREKSDEIFTTAFSTGFMIGLLFLCLGVFAADEITTFLGANAEVYDMTCTYLRMVLIFAPAFILNNMLSAFVKNDGEPKLAMIGMLAGSIFNTIFDYVFIFPMQMGIFGAVLATVCAPIVGMLILSLHFIRKQHNFSLHSKKYQLKHLPTIISRGVPTLITEVTTGIVMIVFNSLILGLTGNVGVAAYGVILNVYLVVIAVFNGVAQGSQPLFGSLYAKGDMDGLSIVFRYSTMAVGALSLVVYIVSMGFPEQLTALFNSEGNATLARLAICGFRIYFLGVFFLGCNIVMLLYYVSVGRAKVAQIMSLSRGMIIVVPLAIILSHTIGMDGIWITAPITEMTVFLFAMLYKRKIAKSLA